MSDKMENEIDINGKKAVYPRLVGGTLVNILLYYKKVLDSNEKEITNLDFFIGFLCVLGWNVKSDMKKNASFRNKFSDLKLCKCNSFDKDYLSINHLESIKGHAFSSSCIKLEKFLKEYVKEGAEKDIVAALLEIIAKDEIVPDIEFAQSMDGLRTITKENLLNESNFAFLPFMMSAILYALKQKNSAGTTTIAKWVLKRGTYSKILGELGGEYRSKIHDTPLISTKTISADNENELQYEITDSDYEAIEVQAKEAPKLCTLWTDIAEKKNLFVETEVYKSTYRTILNKGRVLLCGNPGTGKTMTSEMIAVKMAGRGYTVHYNYGIRDGVSQLYDKITEDTLRKDFILIDDCMGQASVELDSSDGNKLRDLISFVSCHRDCKAILLNSRIRIVNNLSDYVSVRNLYENLQYDKCVINVENLTRVEKALMLRNHICARLDEKYYNDVSGRECFKVIDHEPYIPRVIDQVTKEKIAVRIERNGDFIREIIKTLDNPVSVWSEMYDNKKTTPLEARVLLKAVYSLTNTSCDIYKCRNVFNKYLEIEPSKPQVNRPWDNAVSLLNETMLKRTYDRGRDMIGFIDHSVHDFMDKNVYPPSSPERKSLEKGIMYFEQVRKLGGGVSGSRLKFDMIRDGRIENVIFDDLGERKKVIFEGVAKTASCRESYKSIVSECFKELEKDYSKMTFILRFYDCIDSWVLMLISLVKSKNMRDFYFPGGISKTIYDICIREITIEEVVDLLCAYNSASAHDIFTFDFDSVPNKSVLMKKAIKNSFNDYYDFIDELNESKICTDIDSANAELNQIISSYYLDYLEEQKERLVQADYEMFRSVIENKEPTDYTSTILSHFDLYDDEDETDSETEQHEEATDISRFEEDKKILQIFSQPFKSTKI